MHTWLLNSWLFNKMIAVVITSTAPVFTLQPVNVNSSIGANVMFSGGASGGTIQYLWQYKIGTNWENLQDTANYTNTGTNILNISSVKNYQNNLIVRLSAYNGATSYSSSAMLILTNNAKLNPDGSAKLNPNNLDKLNP